MLEAEKFSLTLWKAHFWELGRSYLFFTQQSGVSDSWFIDPAAECRFYVGQIANIHWIIEKTREFQTKICFIDYIKPFHCVDHNKLWKIMKEMGIPDHLTCLLRNWYTGQEAIVRTGFGTTDWFQIGKGVHQGCILSPCLFHFSTEYIMQNARLDESQAGLKTVRRNINNLICPLLCPSLHEMFPLYL